MVFKLKITNPSHVYSGRRQDSRRLMARRRDTKEKKNKTTKKKSKAAGTFNRLCGRITEFAYRKKERTLNLKRCHSLYGGPESDQPVLKCLNLRANISKRFSRSA